MAWIFEGSEFNEDTSKYYGYVYLIENTINGKRYIGRKYFTKAGYKQVNGKRKKVRKVSDWEEYFGSNSELLKDVETYGADKFVRTILRLCKTRSECNYYETLYQFENRVLESDDWYNSWIQCKIHKRHIANVMESMNGKRQEVKVVG